MSDQPDNPKQTQGSEPLDDFFKSTAPSTPPTSGGPMPYIPPPMQPGQPGRRGPRPLVFIILGVLIGFACICGACIAISGGLGLAIFSNPTVQAVVNTGAAMAGAPSVLPSNVTQKGALTSGQQMSAQLGPTEQHVWTFDGKEGQSITIIVTPQQKSLDPVIGLYDSSGKVLAKTPVLNLSDNATLTQALPADGTYSILVFALGGTASSNGSYSVVVQ